MSIAAHSLIEAAWWPLASAGEALEGLARRHGLAAAAVGLDWPVLSANLAGWLDWAGQQLGVEALPIKARISELPAFLMHGGPALIAVAVGGQPGLLALDGVRRGQPMLLCPDGRRVRIDAGALVALLSRTHTDRLGPEVARVMAAAGIAPGRSERVAAAIIAERVGDEDIDGLTILRLPADADFARQVRLAGLPWRLAQVVGLLALLYGAELWSWSLIGGATIAGRLDWGWLTAWVLLAFTMLPGRLLAGWNESVFAIDLGRLIKSRLLAGALALPHDKVKHQGVGGLIGKVMEAQALEGQALAGAFGVLVGLVELGFAFWVLRQGAAPLMHVILLAGFAAITAMVGLRYHQRIVAWTQSRLGMTNYLVEAMVGHRTRLAQERASRRDTLEDGQLVNYLGLSGAMDRTAVVFGSGLAMAWQVAGILALAPALAGSGVPSAARLAISLGGLLLAQRALGAMGGGLASLSRAGFAWGQVKSIFGAGRRAVQAGLPPRARTAAGPTAGPVLEGQNISFAHAGDRRPVLSGVNLAIAAGDRILIEGPSGGGKSTLAAILTGLRPAEGGLLLCDGLDRHTIGDDWHARVTAAPQFHDNHVLTGTLAFNLLMGRQWPPSETDLQEAEDLCERLGLGDLLRKMPGGLHQQVGETGWQLSHGERSRIFLARALLQKAQVTILDESFASLDPATMDQCLSTALAEAETLVVIAHP